MKNRMANIDTLKVLAIFGVIIIHICSGMLIKHEIASLDWYFSVFWESIVMWSVPIFLMCSGVLFLNPDKIIKIKQLFTKYLLRIIMALVFWAILYEILDIIIAFYQTGHIYSAIIRSIKKLLTFQTHTHFYYLYIIILIYALLPILRVFTDTANKQQMEYALFAWLILGIVFPFAMNFHPFTLIKGIVAQYAISMAYSAIGYFVLGFYLQKYTLKKRTTYFIYSLGVIGIILTICGTIITSISSQTVKTVFLGGMSPNVAAMAAALFLLIKNLHSRSTNAEGKKIAIIKYISKGSFCIYLVHVFFIITLRALGFENSILSPLYSIPLFAILTLIISLGVYSVLSKIPIVNKYLI